MAKNVREGIGAAHHNTEPGGAGLLGVATSASLPFKKRYAPTAGDFFMVVDSDVIFAKNLDMWNIMAEAIDVIDPHIYGQGASWYCPK
ncbi:hypothetical protein PHYSODRAFT_323255 [Phytophthora sojae]|uniref:Uncharacterized protein n=1 Tax=Phytophthora sojae (strain P6497) TaxID=1094619 RepID=G4YL38_PHYSP|nr:hypothetical protein PHYSODRAFT_323255 [Phytophthora sojae]EGZ29793.1 hypothetical protein PHYSODRAFT_323255 [Phytophthora sojae]|eukprot:XP_009517068.1 hypothetical protein PHYSODRAFT_323255 [Phytophthora sojae]